ncbi:MAG: DinB family protein [Dehalococcoidia bacterium]
MPSQTPNVFTFPRNEPGTEGHLELVEPLRTVPRSAADAVRGLSEAMLRYAPADDGWCIKEIIGHLRDAAEVYHKRLYMISTQTDPVLQPYDPDAFAREHNYIERDIEEMLNDLRLFRGDTVQLLTTLVNWNWARTGRHLEDGRLSIRQLVELMIEHESEHLDDIRRLRERAVAELA